VDVVEPVGNETYVYVKAGPDTLCVRLGPVDPPRPGQAVALAADPARLYLFDAKDEGRLA
jgi:multiple sugar transport system ATP-binding protein